jgi:outer membrane protein assembly factor BamB
MAVGADGTLYAATDAGAYAVDALGHKVWYRPFPADSLAALALAADGNVFVSILSDRWYGETDFRSGGLAQVDRCGRKKRTLNESLANDGSATLGKDGTVYFVSHENRAREAPEVLKAASADGVRWSYPVPAGNTVSCPPAVGEDVVYAGMLHGEVVALGRGGVERWTIRVSQAPIEGLALGNDGTIFVAANRQLFALGPDGTRRWMLEGQSLPYRMAPPIAIAENGTLYVAGDGALHAIRPDSTPVWRFEAKGYAIDPIVGKDGTVYAAFVDTDRSGQLVAITPEGAAKWTFYMEAIRSTAMGGDGTLYVATAKRLYALGECTSPPCSDDGTTIAAINYPSPPPSPPRMPSATKPLPTKREAHDGYDVYPGCRGATTAIVTTRGNDFPWYAEGIGDMKRQVLREEFRGRAEYRPMLRSHSSGFGVSCVEPRGAFHITVYPGQDVAAGAIRVGEWMVAANLRGEIDIDVSEPPVAQ